MDTPGQNFFVADGVSGTTFERPDFIRMEEMIEQGEIETVIVKIFFHFGRNYMENGQYFEINCPTLGVRFIAIQESVDAEQNTGAGMMPFHNIFNEWYAAQTSKEIRAVNRKKAENGKLVSSSVLFGYKKNSNDEDHWLIDEPATEIVRKIFDLCFTGQRPSQIARQLENEQIMMPTEYYHSIDKKTSNDLPVNRINEIYRNISSIFERNVCGVISDDHFMTMTTDFETEQRSPKIAIVEAEQKTVDVRILLNGFRKYSEMRERTLEIVNMMIQHIEVHNNNKYDNHCHVKVDIYFTSVGTFERPTEQELQILADIHNQIVD